MKVFVDTCIWSLAFRRKAKTDHDPNIAYLEQLIKRNEAILLGVVRQEILSGIRIPDKFEQLRHKLRIFPDFSLSSEDFEIAAACFNQCRSHGVQGSNTDFLLCSVAMRYKFPLLTEDKDFELFQRYFDFKIVNLKN